MKNYVAAIIICACLFGAVSCAVEGGVVERRPDDIVFVHPVAPGPDYIWLGGEWVWRGGRYHWREGHWERLRNGRAWADGHWEHAGNGWRWQRGHWKK